MNSPLQIKLSDPDISSDGAWINGLSRKECTDVLTALIEGQRVSLNIAVNGAWGSGKTFLLKRWQWELENEHNYTAIYFNAWEDDFVEDPLVAIFGQLWIALKGKETQLDLNDLRKTLVPFLKSNWKSIFQYAAISFMKNKTGIDSNEIEKEFDQTAEFLIFQKYMDLAQTRNALQEKLTDLTGEIYRETGRPLVFIIDELDRCRPTFAIEVLERIKHIFQVDNLIFVFGIDRKQLEKSIQSIYGSIDVENYLHRFFDIDLLIPPISNKDFADYLWREYRLDEYWKSVQSTNNTGKGTQNNRFTELRRSTTDLICRLKLSLREIQQVFKQFIFALKSCATELCAPELMAILVVLKVKNRDLYKQYIDGACDVLEIIDLVVPSESVEWCQNVLVMETIIYKSFISDVYSQNNDVPNPIKTLINELTNRKIPSQSEILSKRLTLAIGNNQLLNEYYFAVEAVHRSDIKSSSDTLKDISKKLEMAPLFKK